MEKKVGLLYRGRRKFLKVKQLSLFGRFAGLMFCRRRNSRALLFNFKKPVKNAIHSLFVFFPFFAVWIDDKNKIIEISLVKPFSISVCPKNSFTKLIEIPVKEEYREILEFLVGNRKI
ncbi:MAG: DUF192 domain-containing protein [archaeon]